jgi:hypothetical protein
MRDPHITATPGLPKTLQYAEIEMVFAATMVFDALFAMYKP